MSRTFALVVSDIDPAGWVGRGLRRSAPLASTLVLAWLAACSTTPRAPPENVSHLPPGNSERDGPEAHPPPDLWAIPDAVPEIEPLRIGGPNKPYEVDGHTYVPITDDRAVVEKGLASWYGKKFHGHRTSSGEAYNMYAMTAAHKTLPIPSFARVRNPANGREIVVRVNDRGPFAPGRIIDLSYTAALKLGVLGGVQPVEIERITDDDIRTGAAFQRSQTQLASAQRSQAPPSTPTSQPVQPLQAARSQQTGGSTTTTTVTTTTVAALPSGTAPATAGTAIAIAESGHVLPLSTPPDVVVQDIPRTAAPSSVAELGAASAAASTASDSRAGGVALAGSAPGAVALAPVVTAPAALAPVDALPSSNAPSPSAWGAVAAATVAQPVNGRGLPPVVTSSAAQGPTSNDSASLRAAVPSRDASPPPVPREESARAETPGGAGFWVQLGAYRQRAGALDFQHRLVDEQPWLAPLLAVFSENGLNRLQAGPYGTREDARHAAERIRVALQLVPTIVEKR